MRIAIQGEAGSFHELAARHWFQESFETVACPNFKSVFEALRSGAADLGIVAIDNSLYGSINAVYDLLSQYDYPIVGEINERIHQQLLGLPDTELKEITEVISHPVALEQCSDFLDTELPRAERREYQDTAAAAQLVKKQGKKWLAAIGGKTAAELAGLTVLRAGIENDPNNYTRFVVIQPEGRPPRNADKVSLLLRTSHQPGALHSALGVFAASGINLTKLQSRPIAGKTWHYQFYVDVEAAGTTLHRAIGELEAQDCDVTILGEYLASGHQHEA